MRRLVIGLAVLALTAAPAFAESFPLDIEVGAVWLDVDGNLGAYRTQLDEEEGVLLRRLAFESVDLGGFADHLRLTADNFGAASPAAGLKLEAGMREVWNLDFRYDRAHHYSSLPAVANPFLGQGVIPGQHTLDRVREGWDLQLEFLPQGMVTPLLGVSRTSHHGPGRTTFHVGEDDFQLASRLDETETEYRAGLGFRIGSWSGRVVQGWRNVDSDQSFALLDGEGNLSRPVLGEDIELEELTRSSQLDVDLPVTTAFVSGRVGSKIRVVGSFIHADAESEGSSTEHLAGHLASFELARFFDGREEEIRSRAESPSWNARLRVEAAVVDHFDVVVGYGHRQRELTGWSLISSLYLDTVNFSGADPKDIEQIVEARTALEREESSAELSLVAYDLGGFGLELGGALINEDVDINEDPSEIVVPGGQEGEWEREIERLRARASWAGGPVTAALEYQKDDADAAVVRSDFLDRERWKCRVAVHLFESLNIGLQSEKWQADNRTSGIGYDGDMKEWSFDVGAELPGGLVLRGAYGNYELESTIVIRRPETFALDTSWHSEDGDTLDLGFDWRWGRFEASGDWSQTENDGVLPYSLDRARLRLAVEIAAGWSVAGEGSRQEYNEDLDNLTDYDANRYGVFVRWQQR